jgi:uncharacterized coiled-coil protein SlyX
MFQGSSTETKIALLEERLNVYEQVIKKIDFAIEKISETSQSINQMLVVHNEKIEQCTKTDNVIIKMVEAMKIDFQNEYEEIGSRIGLMEKKVEDVSRIKWMTIGTGIVLAILAAALSSLASGWWTPTEMQVHRQGHLHQQNVND